MHPSPAPLAIPVLLLLVAGSESEEPAPPASDPAIQGEVLQRHVEVLASDAMEGRLAGSESTRRASAYLAAALEGAGLEPGGWTGSAPSEDEESTWFQQVPLVRQEFDRDPVLTLVDQAGEESSIAYGVEFLLSPAGPDRVRGPYDVVHVRSADDLPEECGPGTALLFHTGRSDQRRLLEEAGHPDGVGLGLVLRAAGSRPGRPTRRPRGGRLRLSDGEAERAPGITLRGPASDAADSWARVTLEPSEKSSLEGWQPLSLIQLSPIMRELKENELASHHSMGVMFWLHRAKLTFQQEKAENNSCHWYH